MPMYTFVCPECGNKQTVLRKMGEYEEVICERCGAFMEREYGSFGIKFNADGFYSTENGSKS